MGRTRGFKPQATQQNEKFAHLVNVKMVDCGVTRKKLMELTGRGSQAAQNATLMAAMDANTAQIIRRTGNDCPIPAYVVQPPGAGDFPDKLLRTVQRRRLGERLQSVRQLLKTENEYLFRETSEMFGISRYYNVGRGRTLILSFHVIERRKNNMAEYTGIALQTVEAGQNVVLTETPVCGSNCIQHREGSGIVKLRGLTNNCKARFLVRFSGNIQIPTGGTVEAISVAIAVDGEPLQSTRMIVTPAAVENFFNVSAQAYIDVPRGCCATVAVENTSTQAIQVQNANLIAVREG